MRRTRCAAIGLFLVAGLLAALGPAVRADDVVTKTDGAKLRGQVVADTPEEVRIKTAGGVIVIPRSDVAKVERAKDVFQELQDRQAALEKKGSAAQWLDLARWCQARELWVPAIDCLHRVLKLDPDNDEARFELGYHRLNGRWVAEAEYFKAKGYVQHEGQWVTKEDKEKLDAGFVKVDGQWVKADEPGGAEPRPEAGPKPTAPPKVPDGEKPAVAKGEAPRRGPANPLGPRRRAPRPAHAAGKAPSAEERKAAVEAAQKSGGFRVAHSSKYYDFYSNGSLDEVKKLAATMDVTCDEFKKVFGYKDEITEPFPVWLFANQQEFMARTNHGPGVGGFYDGEKIVGFHGNLGALTTQTVLFHEGTHQFQGLVFGQNMWSAKIWFIEGLAVYFEACRVSGKKLEQSIPTERLATVKRAIAQGDYCRLSELIRMEQRSFGAFHYAHAWSLIHFLCWGTKGGLERFKLYFDGVKEGKDGVKLFEELFDKPIEQVEEAWKAYVLQLR